MFTAVASLLGCGGAFVFLGPGRAYVEQELGIPAPLAAWLGAATILSGIVLLIVTLNSNLASRVRYFEEQEQIARGDVDRAFGEVSGPADLLGLIRANRKQMDAYDAIARSQAANSYRTSQLAMATGLLFVGTGVAIAVFASSSSTKYAAALVAATGAASGIYISRTFITVQQDATKQMHYYFQQPLVQSYLLTAERLISLLPETKRDAQLQLVLKTALLQARPRPDTKETPKKRRLSRSGSTQTKETGRRTGS